MVSVFREYKSLIDESTRDNKEDRVVRNDSLYGEMEAHWNRYILALNKCKLELADTLGNTNELEQISEVLHYNYQLFCCDIVDDGKKIKEEYKKRIESRRKNIVPFLTRVRGDFGKIYFDTILHYVKLNNCMPDYKIPLKNAFVVAMSNQIIKQLEEVANYTPKPGEESEENVDILKDISLEWLKKSLEDRLAAGENINIDEKMEGYEKILSEQNSIGDILVLLQKWLSEIFSYKLHYLTSKTRRLNYVNVDLKKKIEDIDLPTIFDEIYDELIEDWDKIEYKEKLSFFSSAISTLFVKGEETIKGLDGFKSFRKNFILYVANSCKEGNMAKQKRKDKPQENKTVRSLGLPGQLPTAPIVLELKVDELTDLQKNIIEDIEKELSNNSFGKVDKIIQYIKRAVISNNSVNISYLIKRFGISQLPGKITDLIDELNGTIQKDVELIEPIDQKSTEQNSTELKPTDQKSTEQNPTEPTEIESEERSEIITSFMKLLEEYYEVADGFKEKLEENCKSDGYLLTALKNTKQLSVRQKKGGFNNLWTISIKATGRRLIIEEVKGTKKVNGKKFRVIGMESHSGGYDHMFKNRRSKGN